MSKRTKGNYVEFEVPHPQVKCKTPVKKRQCNAEQSSDEDSQINEIIKGVSQLRSPYSSNRATAGNHSKSRTKGGLVLKMVYVLNILQIY